MTQTHQNSEDVANSAELSARCSRHRASAANLASLCLVIKILLAQVDGLLGVLHAATMSTKMAENRDIVAIISGAI